MNKKLKNNSGWISLLSLLVSAFAIGFSWLRAEPMETDWMAILVGALALLTSVLIGWQILSMINFKTEKDNLFKESEEKFIYKYKSEIDDEIIKSKRNLIIVNYSLFNIFSQKKYGFYERFVFAIDVLRSYNDELFEIVFYEHIVLNLIKNIETEGLSFRDKREKEEIIELFQVILMTIKEPAIKIRLKKIEQYLNTAKVLDV
ncbi:hypothetical protein [Empedobacter brevis]|uniref:hypothetical protein n=1 Tax=Empedobacter brevis TaxID=247 RepID=UPI0023F0EAEA|nr:hypothetical protein [Empedobacter brevis]